ncbi:MAG: 2-oxoglutarate and iron-dependent oxygenase domain-containing protein [Pseudomonadota bacterium]
MDSEIPLVDVSQLDSTQGIERVAAELRHAFARTGFLVVVGHAVEPDLIASVFELARVFHAQPMERKLALRMNEHNNGYMAMERYSVRTSRVSEDALPDMNEAFFLKRERAADDPLVLSGRRFAGPNQWPANWPQFKTTVLDYTGAVNELARKLLAPLAVSLKLPADYFANAFEESQFSFRMSHYPAAQAQRSRYGIAPHTDVNFLTLLAQSENPGLQIQLDSGVWTDVPYIPDSFIVNAGDTLHRWTNGRISSTAHRALSPAHQSRYAIPFFFGPHLDTQIEPIATCVTPDVPPEFAPIRYGDFLDWWYDANYNADDQADLKARETEHQLRAN